MLLSQILAPQVSAPTRARGAAYHASGAVAHLVVTNGVIQATVLGGSTYVVLIDTTQGLLQGSCTCPYFVGNVDICKHVWATLLTAEARGIPLLPPGVAPRDVDLEPMSDEDGHTLDESLDGIIDEDDPWDDDPWPARVPAPRKASTASTPSAERWAQLRSLIATVSSSAGTPARPRIAADGLLFVIDIEASIAAQALVVELMTRVRKANGEWGKPKAANLTPADVYRLPPGETRQLLERLLGARPRYDLGSGYGDYGELKRFTLHGVLVADMLPRMCADDRCVARVPAPPEADGQARPTPRPRRNRWHWAPPPPKVPPPVYLPMQHDAGEPWRFAMTIRPDDAKRYVIDGHLTRGDSRMEVADALLVLGDGMLVTRSHVARLDDGGAFTWLTALRQGSVTVPLKDRLGLVDAMIVQPPPIVEAPDELHVHVETGTPRPTLRLSPSKHRPDLLEAQMLCHYDDLQVLPTVPFAVVRNQDASRVIRRDLEAERRFHATLQALGFKSEWSPETNTEVPQIATRHLPRVVRSLLAEHWQVEAKGVTYRQPSSTSMQVTSGIDWFDLEGYADYDGQQVPLPELLAALRRGDGFVQLGDGTMGLLPEAWLQKHGMLASFASPEGDRLRFRASQVALLDALLLERPETTCDEAFARARAEIQAFDGIAPVDPPASFTGTLREYQREGLGWLLFLQRFGFGGCLADDMGLGKTIMVLALLAGEAARAEVSSGGPSRRPSRGSSHRPSRGASLPPAKTAATAGRPSLVVAPRSLIFNWREEAARFAPGLRVMEYTGGGRTALRDAMADHDLVLTTYGTLRRDAEPLADIPFHYVVLDEAQAIKNASSASAKATRLLRANHRLALSGTPIENHLGELWSLFEFLNPGVLGGHTAFQGTTSRTLDAAAVATLARGLRPFILRRTKAQVAPELPQKTEQTLHCELERPQRALYDQLREHYRATLLDRVSRGGLGRAKLQVLEALLRLRQAACHPGLIDAKRSKEGSAKLDVLLPHIAQAVEEGHKTLVFSQFTSFLAILRARLDAEGITYEYLDGRTRDRQAKVERFQTDPECRLFLISLKAGGVGLNLTAAEYVFLLDPWWNPAVEAQAIDRAHRIGQARHVFAYRLIAKDTVEERVLELQQHKRTLADAVLAADGSLLKQLKKEDLELLLS